MRKILLCALCFFVILTSSITSLYAADNSTYVGTLELTSSSDISSTCVGKNDTWINQNDFASNLHKIKTGDFNGDGIDEFVITSTKGISIVKKGSGTFTSLSFNATNTWIGSWKYNSGTSSGVDRISGIGDFNGDKKDDILISSGSGIAILTMSGNTLTSLAVAYNGTSFSGGWRLDTTNNKFSAIGDFNGDQKAEILLTSPWGFGVISLNGNSFTSPVCAPNGTWFGSWNSNTYDNTISGVGDFDGDNKKEIIITSGWGIGIIKLQSNTFTSLVVAPNETVFGSWKFNTSSKIWCQADINGDRRDEILVTNPSGLGVLRYNGTSLTSIVSQPNGTRFGGWLLDTSCNTIEGTGDFNDDGKKDVVVKSPWGIGILNLSGNTFTTFSLKPYNSVLGNWTLASDNKIRGIGKFGGNKSEILISTIANRIDLRDEIAKRGLSVRDQGGRGTCSVFAMTFIMEYAYTGYFGSTYSDLSEEYANHASNKVSNNTGDGAFFSEVADGYNKYGIVNESLWTYDVNYSYNYNDADKKMTSSMIAQGQGMLSNIFKLKGRFVKPGNTSVGLSTAEFNEILSLLDNGIPVASGRGHSMPIVGYVKNASEAGGGHFILRNSWGINADTNGYREESFTSVKTTLCDVYVYEPIN